MEEAASPIAVEPGSFRDPSSRVYRREGRILRGLSAKAAANFQFIQDSGLLARLADKGWMVSTREVDQAVLSTSEELSSPPVMVLEHSLVPFISHPYEWPFRALQKAALLHLDLHMEALDAGATLSDASAYNVQFDGPRPLFIDVSSLVVYRDGEFWSGHRQFCEQFLNPLLLQSKTGAPYHGWYRGTLEGLPSEHLARVLPLRARLDWRVLTHVVLQARLQSSASRKGVESLRTLRARRLPRRNFAALLNQLRGWIAGLKPSGAGATTWSEYERTRSYDEQGQGERLRFVQEFVAATRPEMLWDFGCNAGEFSIAALRAGAERVVGFDSDHGALALAFERAEREDVPFLPLFLDAANPSPSQGWRERERRGLLDRADCDAVLALAFEHHLAIGRNIPLPQFADWLVQLAPAGVVEFVEKEDPQVQTMLATREDVFQDYSLDNFERLLSARARILRRSQIPNARRFLLWFER